MSLIACLLTCLSGWIVYRLIQGHQVEISPASLALVWVLGAGLNYLVYFVSIALFHANPSALIIIGAGIIGGIDLLRVRHRLEFRGWGFLRDKKWTGILLLLLVTAMSISLFFSGFYADTARMWLAKAEMLKVLPDYGALIRSLTTPYHPDYPMLLTHQFQWQMLWSESLFSLKLPAWMWYISLLLVAGALLARWTKHPLRWLCLLAGFPQYWWIVPIATADIPLSAIWLIAMLWLMRYLEGQTHRSLVLTALCFACVMLCKNEGILILIATLGGLTLLWFQRLRQGAEVQRHQPLYAMLIIGIIAGMTFFSWYGLIVAQTGVSIGGDFALSGFNPARVPQIISWILPILLNPFLTAFLWLMFLLFVMAGYHQRLMLWSPVLCYLGLISVSYFFSVRPTEIEKHIIQSYFRLLLHITPLGLIYVASCFASVNSADELGLQSAYSSSE